MNNLRISTADNRTQFEPGETIPIVAEWSLDDHATEIEIRLVWHTEGKGDTDMDVVNTIDIKSPALRDTYRDSMQLPTKPYSFSGKLVSLLWGLELVVLPSEESTRLGITIAPGGNEVVLHKQLIDA